MRSPKYPDLRQFIVDRSAIEDRGHSTPCWLWQGWLSKKGYAIGWVPGFRPSVRIHRASYELHKGPIPDGLVIDHLCRQRACVNPDHLEVVTAAENNRRRQRVPRTHCRKGHLLEGNRTSSRMCRTCDLQRKRKHQAPQEHELTLA